MKAEIKDIRLIDFDNWNYYPGDSSNFCLAAEAFIGPQGEKGSEIFSFEICSPRWLEQNRGHEAHFARHVIILSEYDEAVVKKAVVDLVDGTTGETWSEIAQKLARYMFWEFEDYGPLQVK